MSVDSAFQRLRDANPVPQPAALRQRPVEASAFLVATQQRSTEMQTEPQPRTTRKAPTPPRRKWMGAVAAFVVVILVGVSIALFTNGSDEPAAGDSPVNIATSYIEARDSWDGEAALALMASDPLLLEGDELFEPENLPALFDIWRAVDWRWTVDECTETAPGPPAEVTCTYTQSNAWTRALEEEPAPGIFYFVIADGEITELSHDFDTTGVFAQSVWTYWSSWFNANVPWSERQDVMYPDGDFGLTPESTVLWEKYSNEFVASVTES